MITKLIALTISFFALSRIRMSILPMLQPFLAQGGDLTGRRYQMVRMDKKILGSKLGRNDICPCESGKKFKHCHGSDR
jgi:hypothetical protein